MLDPRVAKAILAEYEQACTIYATLATTVEDLLKQRLSGNSPKLHSITSRCKDRQSLDRKLSYGKTAYQSLSDVTDIAGVRITTYYAEGVDSVANIVESEFAIDKANSVDKRKLLDPDQFGYLSVHYIAEMGAQRTALSKYARFKDRKFEIQIRSILQHAWAESEHDGYKSKFGVPSPLRRRFSRMAGLLELADDELGSIRDELRAYEAKVAREIREEPERVGIDRTTLRAIFSEPQSAVARLCSVVAGLLDAELVRSHNSVLDWSAAGLADLGITTIGDLEHAIDASRERIEAFAREWFADRRQVFFRQEVVLLFLAYVTLAAQSDDAALNRYLKSAKVVVKKRQNTVARIREAYNRIAAVK